MKVFLSDLFLTRTQTVGISEKISFEKKCIVQYNPSVLDQFDSFHF